MGVQPRKEKERKGESILPEKDVDTKKGQRKKS